MFVFVCLTSFYQRNLSFCWVGEGKSPALSPDWLPGRAAQPGCSSPASVFHGGSRRDLFPLPQAPFHNGRSLCGALIKEDLGQSFPSSGQLFTAHLCTEKPPFLSRSVQASLPPCFKKHCQGLTAVPALQNMRSPGLSSVLQQLTTLCHISSMVCWENSLTCNFSIQTFPWHEGRRKQKLKGQSSDSLNEW